MHFVARSPFAFYGKVLQLYKWYGIMISSKMKSVIQIFDGICIISQQNEITQLYRLLHISLYFSFNLIGVYEDC